MLENISRWLQAYRYAIISMTAVMVLLASSLLFLSRDMAPQLHAILGSNPNMNNRGQGIANVYTPAPTNSPVVPTPTNSPVVPTPTNPPALVPTKPPVVPTPTNQPTPTNTPTSSPNGNLIQDSSFETSSNLWVYGGTALPARTTVQAQTGSYSLKLGLSSGQQGDSTAYQLVTIPASAQTATLSFYYWPASNDSGTYAWQEADVVDSNGNVIQQLFVDTTDDNAWILLSFDLSSYAGQTIGIQFLDHENSNGYAYYTYMYVDNVSLSVS